MIKTGMEFAKKYRVQIGLTKDFDPAKF